MRFRIGFCIGTIVVLSLLTACHNEKEQTEKKPEVSVEDVKHKVGEAVETTRDYVFQQSAEYRKTLEQKLKEIDQQLEEWRPQIEAAKEDVKVKLEKEIAELEKKRALVQQKLEELKHPTKQAWEDLKSGTDAALNELENAFRKAVARFKD